jgi:competence protein ComEA
MSQWEGLQQGKIGLIVLVVMLVAGAGLLLMSLIDWQTDQATLSEETGLLGNASSGSLLATSVPPTPTIAPTPAPVVVYISGAVNNPNVYELEHDARVIDVVRAAGGLAADANRDQVNLAAHIQDAQHIHIPRLGETPVAPSGPGPDAPQVQPDTAGSGPVHINTATAAELETLPGIGPALAQRILEHRNVHGPFATVDDLQNVSGIGPAMLEELRPLVRVD